MHTDYSDAGLCAKNQTLAQCRMCVRRLIRRGLFRGLSGRLGSHAIAYCTSLDGPVHGPVFGVRLVYRIPYSNRSRLGAGPCPSAPSFEFSSYECNSYVYTTDSLTFGAHA